MGNSITLNINSAILESALEYARTKNTDISLIVEELLSKFIHKSEKLSSSKASIEDLQKLGGSLPLIDEEVLRVDRMKYLEEKYR